MKFKTRIWLMPLSAALVFTIGIALSVAVGSRTSTELQALRHAETPALEVLLKVDRGIEGFRLTLQSAAAEGDDGKLEDAAVQAQSVRTALAELARLPAQAEAAQDLLSAFDAYALAAHGAVTAMLGKADAAPLQATMQTTQAALTQRYRHREAAARQRIASAFERVDRQVVGNQWVAGFTGLVALLVLGLSSRLIIRSVWRDLGGEPDHLRQAMALVAAGDLTRADAPTAGPVADHSLRATVATMAAQLGQTVAAIRGATESISTATTEVASGNRDLSSRTEHAASNLQSTASSVERLTRAVRNSAEAAQQASALASGAARAAQRGGEIVTSVVARMADIDGASRKIAEITGVIDGIAFQTNILALNAAVEAARAGEQGRGFAVVAGEVRNLSQRCGQAAREIRHLIQSSAETIESGVQLTHDAGTAMGDIVGSVQRVHQIIADISGATAAQSADIVDVNASIARLDGMTQQNAALVEQASAAAESLKEQTQRLSSAVSVFQLRPSDA